MIRSRRKLRQAVLRLALATVLEATAAAAVLSIVPASPAMAQFFGDRFPFFNSGPAPPPPSSRNNPFSRFIGPPVRARPQAAEEKDSPKAPVERKLTEPPTTKVLVLGDSMADWLAYGLDQAFEDEPDVGIVRKHVTTSGLISYEKQDDGGWAAFAKRIIAAEKPNYIVMMVGLYDRRSIRESRTVQQPAEPAPDPSPALSILTEPEKPAEPAPPPKVVYDTFEFRSEGWQAAYIKRIDATIAALKSAGVPVIWVGLPPIRGSRSTADMQYLNDFFHARAQAAGIVYVDTWEGFIDDKGRYTSYGPDFEGQRRRLRTGVHFTPAGARKLAHYVERELRRFMANQAIPIALPTPDDPSELGPAVLEGRPLAGPVLPLKAYSNVTDELLGGSRPRPAVTDPLAIRVLVRGEALDAPNGRADDFAWPRGALPDKTLAPPNPPPVAEKPPSKSTPAKPQATVARSSPSAAPAPARTAAAPPPARQSARPRSLFEVLFGRVR